MLTEFINPVLVGICAAAPLGPVAALVIQKTLCYGRRAGFVTACGSAVIDIFYGVIGVFALGLVSGFIEQYTPVIEIVGGFLLAFVGAFMALRDPFKGMKEQDRIIGKLSPSFPLQAAMFSLANPGALVLMLGLVALFNTGEDKLLTIAGIAVGVLLWWWFFTYLISRSRKFFNINTLVVINKIIGAAVVIFGIIWIVRVFLVIG